MTSLVVRYKIHEWQILEHISYYNFYKTVYLQSNYSS